MHMAVRLQKILSMLESQDANIRIHAVKIVANLAAEGDIEVPFWSQKQISHLQIFALSLLSLEVFICIVEEMQSKSNGADFFDSEMFGWTQSQRACSPDLLLSPTKMQVTYIGEVEGVQEVIIPQDLLKKYITYAKLNVFPRLHDADMDKLTHVYAELRGESSVR
ncbi:hypothetical protein Ancab_038049 [Ancistrocladus abbreviatus]